jgi:hypothetical protein
VDEQTEAAERALAFEPRHQVVGQRHPLERRSEHELTRVEDERLVVADLDLFGQLLLRLLDVDERVARVVEHAEVAVDADVHARRLEERRVIRVDRDAAFADEALDGAIGKDHRRILPSGRRRGCAGP